MSIAGAIKGISVSVTALSSEDRMEVSILDNLMNRTSHTRIHDPTTWCYELVNLSLSYSSNLCVNHQA